MTMRMLFATRSEAKTRELVPIMQKLGVTVISLRDLGIAPHPDEERIEIFDTFEENALAKARWFGRVSGGMPVLADDSGLEIDVLEGKPGVRSKRWSGRDDLTGQALDDANNQVMIQTLSQASAAISQMLGDALGPMGSATMPFVARYVCAAACVWPGGEEVVRGNTVGNIIPERRGAGGFGYDPYFYSDELGKTFGEVDGEEKERVSHRGRAFRMLGARLARSRSFERFFEAAS